MSRGTEVTCSANKFELFTLFCSATNYLTSNLHQSSTTSTCSLNVGYIFCFFYVGLFSSFDDSLSRELTDILLDGDAVDIEVEDKNHNSALRALRKLNIDYEIIE